MRERGRENVAEERNIMRERAGVMELTKSEKREREHA